MTDPAPEGDIEFSNDVPGAERLLWGFFVLVAAPLMWLIVTQPEGIPTWAAILFGGGIPLVLVVLGLQAFGRTRVRCVLPAGAREAVLLERRGWRWKERRVQVERVDLDMSTDIDGDPYGKLFVVLPNGDGVCLSEGNDIEGLESSLESVRRWLA